MNVTIIDDERPAITLLSAYVQRTGSLVLESSFTDPMDALEHFNKMPVPELTFLDVNMPGISGIDFARIVGSKTKIILTTSFRDYGPEAFELLITDYLLKPFSYERFLAAVEKVPAGQTLIAQLPDFFYVRTETRGKYLRITVQDIISVEGSDNAVRITMHTGIITAVHTLADVQSWLPAREFFRIHRSYIINLSMIHAVDHGQVHLNNGAVIPIGRQFREQFMDHLNRLIISGR
jgi:two-component system LytT family response regulator